MKDLIAAALAAGMQILFEVKAVRLEGIDGDAPCVHFIDSDGNSMRTPDITRSTWDRPHLQFAYCFKLRAAEHQTMGAR